MIDATQIQIDAALEELKLQRNDMANRSIRNATELALKTAEVEVLRGRVRSLEDQLAKAKAETLDEPSEAAAAGGG